MVSYRFENVVTRKKAIDLLNELRKENTNVVGVSIMYATREAIINFEAEPNKDELESIKTKLNAESYEKVEEGETA